jgi:hypothetical protein
MAQNQKNGLCASAIWHGNALGDKRDGGVLLARGEYLAQVF